MKTKSRRDGVYAGHKAEVGTFLYRVEQNDLYETWWLEMFNEKLAILADDLDFSL